MTDWWRQQFCFEFLVLLIFREQNYLLSLENCRRKQICFRSCRNASTYHACSHLVSRSRLNFILTSKIDFVFCLFFFVQKHNNRFNGTTIFHCWEEGKVEAIFFRFRNFQKEHEIRIMDFCVNTLSFVRIIVDTKSFDSYFSHENWRQINNTEENLSKKTPLLLKSENSLKDSTNQNRYEVTFDRFY